MGVDGNKIRMIQYNAILDQIANDNAAACDRGLPAKNQKPSCDIRQTFTSRSGCALGLKIAVSVKLSHGWDLDRSPVSYNPLILPSRCWEAMETSVCCVRHGHTFIHPSAYQELSSHIVAYRNVDAIREKIKVQNIPPVPPSNNPKPKLVKVFCHATTTVLQNPTIATNLKLRR